MNLYKKKIYRKSLQHAERRNHKYLYKIGDRYIYPEDVAGKTKSTASNIGSMATAAGTAAKNKISNTIADQKTKLKDKKYLWDENRRKYPNLEKANVTSPGGKRVNQITSAHQEGTKKTTALSYQSTHDPISNKVVKVKRDFDANGNQIGVGYSTESSHIGKKKSKKATEQQRKSAHAGYEADKKLFPEGGSTEELEYQKKKTTARKTKARTDSAIEEMRKRKKRMDASVESVKPTRNISGVKPSGKAPVKETPTPEKKRHSIDRDDLRTYKKAAGMMLDEGRQNEINRRKERSERTKAGNAKMAKEINSENAKKVGKAILYNSKLGRLVKAGESMDDNKKQKKRKASR